MNINFCQEFALDRRRLLQQFLSFSNQIMYEGSCVPDATLEGATTLKALAHATKTAIRRMTASIVGALFWKLL